MYRVTHLSKTTRAMSLGFFLFGIATLVSATVDAFVGFHKDDALALRWTLSFRALIFLISASASLYFKNKQTPSLEDMYFKAPAIWFACNITTVAMYTVASGTGSHWGSYSIISPGEDLSSYKCNVQDDEDCIFAYYFLAGRWSRANTMLFISLTICSSGMDALHAILATAEHFFFCFIGALILIVSNDSDRDWGDIISGEIGRGAKRQQKDYIA